MNTVVTLNLEQVRRRGMPAPTYAVADLIPVAEGQAESPAPTLGLVLELENKRSLERRIAIGEGPVVVNVRFPTGELLSQRVVISSENTPPTISFVVPSQRRHRRSGVHAPAESVEPVEKPIPNKLGPHKSNRGDRSHWGVVSLGAAVHNRERLHTALRNVSHKTVNPRQGHHGMARVQSIVADQSPRSGKESTPQHLDFVGGVVALQPVKLYGDVESLHTQWKLPLRSKAQLGRPDSEARLTRFFALAYRQAKDIEVQQIACVPGRWKKGDDSWARLGIMYDADAIRESGAARVRISVDDPEIGVMLQYLQTGDIESAYALFDKAFDELRRKFINPYAAMAGAYVLLYSGLRDRADEWSQWVYNLATEFRALPDGMILLATLYLQTPAGESGWLYNGRMAKHQVYELALEAVTDAVRRGPPLYRLGLLLLSANLQILAGVLRDKEQLRQINQASIYVQALNLRADPSQPFCVFDIVGNEFIYE